MLEIATYSVEFTIYNKIYVNVEAYLVTIFTDSDALSMRGLSPATCRRSAILAQIFVSAVLQTF